MPIKEKTNRNKEIYKRRKAGWTLGQLAEHYGVKRPTIVWIVQREEKRQSVSTS